MSPSVASLLCLLLWVFISGQLSKAQLHSRKPIPRLFKPLLAEDGTLYTCTSSNTLLAFESNGSISWSLPLPFSCNASFTPIRDDTGKIYLVAENRVLEVNPRKIGTFESALQVFFEQGEIVGLALSAMTSSLLITIDKRGLFSYARRDKLIWSVGPAIQRFGYRQGCRRGFADCHFTSTPVVDQCEGSVYISNSQGELYSLSILRPYFKWILDLSSFGKSFNVVVGNSGRLYVVVPDKAVLVALDVASGSILWKRSIGCLSNAKYAPVVDSNGWISVGSLDGFLYSFSPDGRVRKYKKMGDQESVFQVSPMLDCSGYGVYVTQTKMEGKVSKTVGEYTYVSALRPVSVVFMLLVPATGIFYWSETYPGAISSFISNSDLQHFILDEEVLLAFLVASKTGNPLKCRTTGQKLSSSCSKTKTTQSSMYTSSERAVLLFLLFETIVLVLLAGLVRFCCVFWGKKKIQGRGLGGFLEKRRSLRLKKKAYDKTIQELEQETEKTGTESPEHLGDIKRERESISRKLSTSYSLGSDGHSKSILPVFDWKQKTIEASSNSSSSSNSDNDTTRTSSSDDEVVSGTRRVSGAPTSSGGHGRSLLQRRSLSSTY